MDENKKEGLLESQITEAEKQVEVERDPRITKLEERLRILVEKTISDFKSYVFPEAYDIIKAKVLFAGDVRALYKRAGWKHKSCDVYPLIDSTHDTYSANMYDTTISTRAIARNPDDIEKTQTAQDFYDWCYSITKADDVREDIRNEASLIGTGYGMAGFRNYTKKLRYRTDVDTTKDVEDEDIRPTLEHVSFFEMFYPVGATDFYNTPWKFRRKVMSFSNLKEKYSKLLDFDEEVTRLINNSNHHISTTDFNKIWDIKSYEKAYVDACTSDSSFTSSPNSFVYDNLFSVVEKKNDMCEVIEFWEDGEEGYTLALMVNGRVIYDGESPYPTGDPFGIVVFEKRPGTCRGRGIGHKLMTHQKQANTYYNRIVDGINMHIDPMYIIQRGQIVGKDGKTPTMITHIPGGTIESVDASVNNGGIKPLDLIDYNIISLAMQDLRNCREQAMEIIGTNSYSQGGQGKVERSFGAVNSRLGVTRSRLAPILKSLNKFDAFMFETWLAVSTSLMPANLMIRVLGDQGIQRWADVSPKDILNRFDFECDSEAGRQASKAERAQTLVNTINTLSPFFIDPVSKMPLVNPADIIQKAIEQLDFAGVTVMTKEERIQYLKDSQEVQASIAPQGPQDPNGVPPAPAQPPVAEPQQDTNAQLPGESDFAYFQRTGVEKPIV